MKYAKHLFALSLLISGAMLSCSRSYNDVSALTPTYSSMEDVFSALAVQPKTITVDAGSATTFYGNSGTRYIFAANSFLTASGTPVTGNVTISAAEYIDKGDMLFSKMLPISNSEPLLSGGEINVSASQNGQTLVLKPGSVFQANLPIVGNLPPNLTFFSGQANQDTTQFRTNWVQPVVNPGPAIGAVEMVTPDTLGILSDSLKQCNADAFMTPLPAFQDFTVTVQVTGGTLSPSHHVYGYTFYDTYKAEWPLGYIGSYANGVFNEQHVPTIPVHFVVFTLINGKFYGGISSATPVTGKNYTITIAQVDATAFKKKVSAL